MFEIDEGINMGVKDAPDEVETDTSEVSDVDENLDINYESYVNENKAENFEYRTGHEMDETEADSTELIKCRNGNLEGQNHPETGVPFEKQKVEINGKNVEIIAPSFESTYDAQLPNDLYQSSDRQQFKECNNQLKNEVAQNPEVRNNFSDEEIKQIENGDTPDGYTWHHDIDEGKMQLVDTETHQKTGHTGGRSVWGGGTENR